jgi:hypothetical protein
MSRDLMIGLSSWILEDGNYKDFRRGDRASFALAFCPADSSDWPAVNPSGVDRASMCHVEGSEYLVTARVTDVLEDASWWVIDAGVLMYAHHRPPDGIEPGCWVSGKCYVGVDPFVYFDHLSRYHAAPALIYDWDVTKIDLEITPVIESGSARILDRSRRGWRDVDDTKSTAGSFMREFVLHCSRLDTPPRR